MNQIGEIGRAACQPGDEPPAAVEQELQGVCADLLGQPTGREE